LADTAGEDVGTVRLMHRAAASSGAGASDAQMIYPALLP